MHAFEGDDVHARGMSEAAVRHAVVVLQIHSLEQHLLVHSQNWRLVEDWRYFHQYPSFHAHVVGCGYAGPDPERLLALTTLTSEQPHLVAILSEVKAY